jgi:hypothetical protein
MAKYNLPPPKKNIYIYIKNWMLPLNECFCCPYCETGSAANWKNRIKIKMKSRKLWRLTVAFHFDEDPDLHKKPDPDPYPKTGSGSR